MTHRLATIVLATLAVFESCVTPARAAGTDRQLKPLLDKLQHHYQATKSFTASFHEQIKPAGGLERTRQGIVYYRKPGKMRWEFGGEEHEILVSDGKTLYTYQPDLNQVIETPIEQAFRSSRAAAFLLGVGNVERDFDASTPARSPTDGLKHVILKPKAGGDTIEMGLDPKTLDIRKLNLTDQLGNLTVLELSDLKKDVALADDKFAFVPPKGVDIVTAPPEPAQNGRQPVENSRQH